MRELLCAMGWSNYRQEKEETLEAYPRLHDLVPVVHKKKSKIRLDSSRPGRSYILSENQILFVVKGNVEPWFAIHIAEK